MWIFFGVISLSLFTVVAFRARLHASWKGEARRTPEGVDYEVLERRNKGRLIGFIVGVRGSGPFTCSLRREGAAAGLAKEVGLSVEVQTGDAAFDEQVYVVSDDPIFCRTLKESETLRRSVLALFALRPSVRLNRVQCAAGRLWCVYSLETNGTAEDLEPVALQAAPVLADIAAELARVKVTTAERLRDPFILRAAAVLAVSTALGVFALIGLFRSLVERPQIMVDASQLWGTSILVSLVALAMLAFAALSLLGRSSRAHLVLIELLLVGGFGAAGSCYILMRDLNELIDDSAPRAVEVKVHGRQTDGGKHKSYYLLLEDFTGELQGTRKMQVRHGLYIGVRSGDKVRVTLREGGLGFAWIEAIEPVRPSR